MLTGYRVQQIVGCGGMGAVYRARQISLDRDVAIKVLPPDADLAGDDYAKRFTNEARTMARLNHPGIVHVHEFGETTAGLLYFAMEFIEGSDLFQTLQQHGKLAPEFVLPVILHVCDALEYAHAHGVVHRDIKPANIMLTREGLVKVADFGLAKLDTGDSVGLTKTGVAYGTPDYVAPETLARGGIVDGRADLYAVGVLIYNLLTGILPRGSFELPSRLDPRLDPRLDVIVARALKPIPDERYQSAAELRAAIAAVMANVPAPAATSEASLISKGSRMKRLLLINGGLALVSSALFVSIKPTLEKWRSTDVAVGVSHPAEQADASPVVAAQSDLSTVAKAPFAIDDSKWLPLTYPADFGKIDGGVTQTPDGAVTLEGGYGKRLRARWGQTDVAVRARVQIPRDGEAIIGLRTDMSKAALRVVIRPETVEVIHEALEDQDSSDHNMLHRFDDLGSDFDPVRGAIITTAVLGDQCLVWLDKTYLGSVSSNNLPTEGKILFDGINATFHEMQWQVIGDTSALPTPTAPLIKAEDITGVWPRPGNPSQCILYPDGKITLINKDGQEDRRSDGTPYWIGRSWRIVGDKAHLSTADGVLQEEWTVTQPGTVAIRQISNGSTSTSKRSSTTIPAIKPPTPLAKAAPVPASATTSQKPEPSPQKPALPAELQSLQDAYAAAIAERVTAPHESGMKQLTTGYLAALDRAVSARQLSAAAIKADQEALAAKAALPPDIETTPEALAALRATFRAKATEYDDARTTAHLALLTPYIAKLRELEAELTQKGRPADAAAVSNYREMLGQNPLALPEPAKP